MQIDTKSKKAIEDVINRRTAIHSMQEQIKEDIKAIAEYLDIKPAQLNKIIGLVEKERENGDVVESERDILDTVEDIAGSKSTEGETA
ncbi:hypothetical protein [Acidithiobacillus ferrivorans]|uniref:Uncharacterized protein n=1 Tax=Acidithiobacillus ferrivorans TaxID=160808 RepID=A0A7T4WEC7_9PROT|nr:hypothetical protein [Acidithiobacillus ferrivorans]QQD73080.1 hypothetical protein H2515_01710 [Acidithiobacillus ferrivorans]